MTKLNENPLLALGAVGTAKGYDLAKAGKRKVDKAVRWVKKNPGKVALGLGATAALTSVKMMAGQHDLPYNQGGQYQDPYFRKESIIDSRYNYYAVAANPLGVGMKAIRDQPVVKKIQKKVNKVARPAIVKGLKAIGEEMENREEIQGEVGREDIILENIRGAVDFIAADSNQVDSREMIHAAIGERVLDLLAAKKQSLAKTIFAPSDDSDEA